MREPAKRNDLLQGTLDLMILQTLEALGPLHGYGLARRLEQVSAEALSLNQGTVYPALVRLEQGGHIRSSWGSSENNRRARFYTVTASGRRRLERDKEGWRRTVKIVERVLAEAALAGENR